MTCLRPYRWLWVLTLCGAMACSEPAAPVSDAERAPGVTTDEILLGTSLALEGTDAYLGTQTLQGAMAYLNRVNDQGGIHGRKIRVISRDDGYDPARCLANTQQLIIEDRVFGLFCYVGTPTAVKIMPLVREAAIPLVGVLSGARILRQPTVRTIVNIRAAYFQEAEAAIGHMIGDLNLHRIAVFYQNDEYGFDGLQGIEMVLKRYGLAPVATGTYIRGILNVEDGLRRIQAASAQAVILVGTYEPCARFIQQARTAGYNPLFYSLSSVGAEALARRLGGDAEGVIVTQVVPPPGLADACCLLPGVLDYVALQHRYFPGTAPSFIGMEGYLNARVLVEGLRRAGRKLTREGFIDAVETIQDFSLEIGSSLSFGPDDHQGLDRIYFTQIRNGRIELITDWNRILPAPSSAETF